MKKNEQQKQLIDAVNKVKQLCAKGRDKGAIFLMMASQGQMEELRRDLPEYFQTQSDLAEEFIQALEIIHTLCSKDKELAKYVKKEYNYLIRFQALEDTITGNNKFQELVGGKGSMER
jgi:hypothetical protein